MRIRINGEEVEVREGTSVAAAVLNWHAAGAAGRGGGFRTSVSGEPRWPVCGMGVCYECRAKVNGIEHVRTCLLSCAEGMEVETGG
jgi:hypothetical protein